MDEGKLIARIERSKTADIRIRLVEFGGKPFVDMRTFVSIDGKDERIPTKKGVAIPPGLVGAVIDALREADREAVGDPRRKR